MIVNMSKMNLLYITILCCYYCAVMFINRKRSILFGIMNEQLDRYVNIRKNATYFLYRTIPSNFSSCLIL